MMVEPRNRGGRKPTISDDEIRALLDKGMNNAEIARQVGLTPAAIGQRVRKLGERDAQKVNRLLPWTVRDGHSSGWVYRAVVGYAKRRRGEGLTAREHAEAAQLEQFLHENDQVVGYDYSKGFYLRTRTHADAAGVLLVKD